LVVTVLRGVVVGLVGVLGVVRTPLLELEPGLVPRL